MRVWRDESVYKLLAVHTWGPVISDRQQPCEIQVQSHVFDTPGYTVSSMFNLKSCPKKIRCRAIEKAFWYTQTWGTHLVHVHMCVHELPSCEIMHHIWCHRRSPSRALLFYFQSTRIREINLSSHKSPSTKYAALGTETNYNTYENMSMQVGVWKGMCGQLRGKKCCIYWVYITRTDTQDHRGEEGRVLPSWTVAEGPKETICEFSLNTAKESHHLEKCEQGKKKQAVNAGIVGWSPAHLSSSGNILVKGMSLHLILFSLSVLVGTAICSSQFPMHSRQLTEPREVIWFRLSQSGLWPQYRVPDSIGIEPRHSLPTGWDSSHWDSASIAKREPQEQKQIKCKTCGMWWCRHSGKEKGRRHLKNSKTSPRDSKQQMPAWWFCEGLLKEKIPCSFWEAGITPRKEPLHRGSESTPEGQGSRHLRDI